MLSVLQTSYKSGFALAVFAASFSQALFWPLLPNSPPRAKQHPCAEGSVPTMSKEMARRGQQCPDWVNSLADKVEEE